MTFQASEARELLPKELAAGVLVEVVAGIDAVASHACARARCVRGIAWCAWCACERAVGARAGQRVMRAGGRQPVVNQLFSPRLAGEERVDLEGGLGEVRFEGDLGLRRHGQGVHREEEQAEERHEQHHSEEASILLRDLVLREISFQERGFLIAVAESKRRLGRSREPLPARLVESDAQFILRSVIRDRHLGRQTSHLVLRVHVIRAPVRTRSRRRKACPPVGGKKR